MNKKILGLLAVGVLGTAATLQAHAVASQCDAVAGNLVTNCGFETAGSNALTIPGWTSGGSGIVFRYPFGDMHSGVAAVVLAFDAPGSATISQSVGGAGTYDVSFWLGLYDAGVPNPSRVPQVSVSFGGQQLSISTPPNGGQPTPYGFYSFTNLVIAGPATLLFETTGLTEGVQYYDLFIDDVVVTGLPSSTVPEPGTLTLLGIGLAGLALSRRRRAA